MPMIRQRAWRALMFGALMLAAGLGLDGVWIHAKAALAQLLLERAWARSDHGRLAQRPWPWADIAPLARLRVPRLHQDLIVLDGDSGQALAFGPGWSTGGVRPGAAGLGVISAHRDTQFRFLPSLHPGDRLVLDGPRGSSDYVVTDSRVIDRRQARIPPRDSMDGLWLVTCYPFDAVVPGGPLRYVVQARRLKLNDGMAVSPRIAGTKADQPGQNW
ncbi:class GN sortase [Rhodanobacter spathiphylli]|uniref:Sortase family protein, Peptidase C60 n=1 Tax=Rhodanobacter spathiphylli B39 TaxID=1163407 RepID=I4W1Y3_9GAMM|nr:class GN sortase [Rhodanobacter spathiphylli]EIL93474.1 sortase family protein, Peptidase C60 [Rhodanobacter spathiphylli B39]